MKTLSAVCTTAVLALLAGCFEEPVPAFETADPATRIYLSDGKLARLTKEAVYADGAVYIEGAGKTNLSAVAAKLDFLAVVYLNLDRNALTNVDELADFRGLKWLRLNGNALDSLPDLSVLANLKRIYLADNRFSSVPETLKRLPSLLDVDLSGNPIESLPEWFTTIKGLESVSLSRTKLTRLPDDLSSWRSLNSLELGETGIGEDEMKRIRAALPTTRVVF